MKDKKENSKIKDVITTIGIIIATIGVIFEIYYNIIDHGTPTSSQESSTISQESTPYDEDSTNSQESISYEENSTDVQETIVSNISMDNITDVAASSYLSEYNMLHSPERMIDGILSTAWVEGASGQGINESVTLTFNNTYILTGLTIYAGYHKNEDLYYKNSRPKEIYITFSNGSSESHTLNDSFNAQNILLSKPISTSYITIFIESVYPGNKFEDTVISELILR